MASVNELIDEAIDSESFSTSELNELPFDQAQRVAAQARAIFVNGNPRVWWLGLKQKPQIVEVQSNNFFHLQDHWPKDEEKCYFIPENEEDFRVFEVTLSGLIKILSATSFFEYYLVGKSLDWLMVETDHNEFLIVR